MRKTQRKRRVIPFQRCVLRVHQRIISRHNRNRSMNPLPKSANLPNSPHVKTHLSP